MYKDSVHFQHCEIFFLDTFWLIPRKTFNPMFYYLACFYHIACLSKLMLQLTSSYNFVKLCNTQRTKMPCLFFRS